MRGPDVAPPGGARWVFRWFVGAEEHGAIDLSHDRQHDPFDGALVTSSLTGNQTFGFELRIADLADDAEVEVPAVYVDALVDDTTLPRPSLINRAPEPNDVDVPRDTVVRLALVDPLGGAGGISLASLRVYLNGVLAYSGMTGFQVGYTGGRSMVTVHDPSHIVVVVDPIFLLDSLAPMTVRVVATESAGAPWTLDTSYLFTVVDETPPQVISATATGLYTVRVAFDEAMQMVSSEGADDVLNPALWELLALDPPTVPAFVPTLASVTPAGSMVADLTFSQELSFSSRYEIRCLGAVDLYGNPMVAPLNRAQFVSAAPPSPPGRQFDIWSWIPTKNKNEDLTGNLRKFILCLQEMGTLLLLGIDRFADFLDPDLAPEWAIDLWLEHLGNPFRLALSLTDRRRLLGLLVPLYKQKGTNPGIKNALRFFLGLDPVDIRPFTTSGFELGIAELGTTGPLAWELGPPAGFSTYAFDVQVYRLLTAAEEEALRDIVEYMKPAHTHFVHLLAPVVPEVVDHVELGLSELGGDEWQLH